MGDNGLIPGDKIGGCDHSLRHPDLGDVDLVPPFRFEKEVPPSPSEKEITVERLMAKMQPEPSDDPGIEELNVPGACLVVFLSSQFMGFCAIWGLESIYTALLFVAVTNMAAAGVTYLGRTKWQHSQEINITAP